MSVCTEEVKEYYGPKIMEFLGEYTMKLYEHLSTKDAKEYHFYFTLDEPNLCCAVDLPCTPPQMVQERSALGVLGPRLLYLYFYHNRWEETKEVGNKILSNLKRLQDQLGEADTLMVLGVVAVQTGNLEEARSKYEKALAIYQNIGYKRGEANTLWELGDLIMLLGDLDEARSKYEKALAIYQNIGENLGEANTLMHLGFLIMLLGDLDETRSKYEKALAIHQHIGKNLGEANTLKHLGDLAVQTGDLEEARSKYEKALAIYQNINDKDGEASALIRLGQWAALTDKLEYAKTNLNSAFTLCREIRNFEGQAEVHMVKALVFFKHTDIVKAKYELDCCSSIQDRTCTYCKAVQWLILYAAHLRLHGFREGAKLCLEYAEEFALKTQNHYLQNQVKQQSETM